MSVDLLLWFVASQMMEFSADEAWRLGTNQDKVMAETRLGAWRMTWWRKP